MGYLIFLAIIIGVLVWILDGLDGKIKTALIIVAVVLIFVWLLWFLGIPIPSFNTPIKH